MESDFPTSGDYAWSAAQQNATDLQSFKLALAEFFSGVAGTPTARQHAAALAEKQISIEALQHIIEECFTATSIDEVRAIIQGRLVKKEV